MQNEISSGTMLGIVLIALAAVIGLGFGVFSIAKGVSNEGVVNVQDNLGTVSQSAFQDYDQRVVTGTQVIAAYKAFQGKPVAILINTQAMTKGVLTSTSHATAYSFSIGDDKTKFINYNAVLASTAEGGSPVTVVGGTAVKDKGTDTVIKPALDGSAITAYGFALDTDGKVRYDASTGGFSKAGNCEYISSSAKFESTLIKDASDSIVGVLFKQLAK